MGFRDQELLGNLFRAYVLGWKPIILVSCVTHLKIKFPRSLSLSLMSTLWPEHLDRLFHQDGNKVGMESSRENWGSRGRRVGNGGAGQPIAPETHASQFPLYPSWDFCSLALSRSSRNVELAQLTSAPHTWGRIAPSPSTPQHLLLLLATQLTYFVRVGFMFLLLLVKFVSNLFVSSMASWVFDTEWKPSKCSWNRWMVGSMCSKGETPVKPISLRCRRKLHKC